MATMAKQVGRHALTPGPKLSVFTSCADKQQVAEEVVAAREAQNDASAPVIKITSSHDHDQTNYHNSRI